MIEDGETGVLVPFGDEELLAKQIIRILSTPQLHEQMCQNAWKSSRRFSRGVVAERWARLIREMLQVGLS